MAEHERKTSFFFFAFDNNTAHNDSAIREIRQNNKMQAALNPDKPDYQTGTGVLSMSEKGKKGRCLAFGLGALQVFIGIGGVAGGFGLVTEPSGANLGFDVDLLSTSPFSDYLIPGLILLVVIGLGSLAGGVLSMLRYRYAGKIAAVSGSFLMIWITTQVCWIGLTVWLQPLFFCFGVVELVMGLLLRRGRKQKSGG